MKIDQAIRELKEHLERNLDYDDWQGDTESGFYSTINFTMEDLWDEINTFCEYMKERNESIQD